MPLVDSTPRTLKAFTNHGVELSWNPDSEQARGECPFCGKQKFHVALQTGLWDCKGGGCGESGNPITFLRKLWEESRKVTRESDLETLRKDRKLLRRGTLRKWGVVRSLISGEWLVPGYDVRGELWQLYRYARLRDGVGWVHRVMPTGGVHEEGKGHGLHGVPLLTGKDTIALCEGCWDGMSLWESLQSKDENSSVPQMDVLAVPSCQVWQPSWGDFFKGKTVYLLFDSDHPKEGQGGKRRPPAGYEGMKRLGGLLLASKNPPREVKYLQWGKEGYDPEKPSGYDVRDLLSSSKDRRERVTFLLGNLQPVPKAWVDIARARGVEEGSDLSAIKCSSWGVLTNAWRKALTWTEGLDRTLSVMLASVASTKSIEDQLWIMVISPPSSGKSVLCEALAVSKKYVVLKSTVKGFHSGYQTDKQGTEDHSLIAKVNGRTMVTKDGDTLLGMPNKDQILAEARDIYDGTANPDYRNRMSRDWAGIKLTWILCGTPALRQLDTSELGERFLRCVIMDEIDPDFEDETTYRVINRVSRNVGFESNGKASEQHDEDKIRAMQLTGGYVEYLRENAIKLVGKVEMDDDVKHRLMRWAVFVAYMRARPSKKQDESTDREVGFRLGSQLTKLAMFLTVVLGKTRVDQEVMRRVERVALDTCKGVTMEIARVLYRAGTPGVSRKALTHYVNQTEPRLRELLSFLLRIRAVEQFVPEGGSQFRWRLSPRLHRLYYEVTGEVPHVEED